jgi:hypothetical protein|tara:strand:- start:1279 stop:1473 length:195 start_codon:yes stop_codon:yes gene_type:complete
MMDTITKILTEYEERFGPLPDSRLMSEDAVANMVELCAMANRRGFALTVEETGLAQDTPEGVTV